MKFMIIWCRLFQKKFPKPGSLRVYIAYNYTLFTTLSTTHGPHKMAGTEDFQIYYE